jgi:hypothetical protein
MSFVWTTWSVADVGTCCGDCCIMNCIDYAVPIRDNSASAEKKIATTVLRHYRLVLVDEM